MRATFKLRASAKKLPFILCGHFAKFSHPPSREHDPDAHHHPTSASLRTARHLPARTTRSCQREHCRRSRGKTMSATKHHHHHPHHLPVCLCRRHAVAGLDLLLSLSLSLFSRRLVCATHSKLLFSTFGSHQAIIASLRDTYLDVVDPNSRHAPLVHTEVPEPRQEREYYVETEERIEPDFVNLKRAHRT